MFVFLPNKTNARYPRTWAKLDTASFLIKDLELTFFFTFGRYFSFKTNKATILFVIVKILIAIVIIVGESLLKYAFNDH